MSTKLKKQNQWIANYYFRLFELTKVSLHEISKIVEPEYKERKVERHTLKEYIEFLGTDAAAELFGCPVATVKSWRYGHRQPTVKQAKLIIKATGGKLDFESIYGPVDEIEV